MIRSMPRMNLDDDERVLENFEILQISYPNIVSTGVGYAIYVLRHLAKSCNYQRFTLMKALRRLGMLVPVKKYHSHVESLEN